MVDLQELIVRGRFIFSGASKRLDAFRLVNGRLSAKDIARKTGRRHSSVLNDLGKLRDVELVGKKMDKSGNILKKDGSTVFEKTPLARQIPYSYYEPIADTRVLSRKNGISKRASMRDRRQVHIPNETEILEICKNEEDQLYEFKSPGTSTHKITKELAAFMNTKNGGVLLYGVEDDGTILGSDTRRADFDQRIQNSVRNSISPTPRIEVVERDVLGTVILLVVVPPFNRKTAYQYREKYYIRKGTNVFSLKPDEIRELLSGGFVA